MKTGAPRLLADYEINQQGVENPSMPTGPAFHPKCIETDTLLWNSFVFAEMILSAQNLFIKNGVKVGAAFFDTVLQTSKAVHKHRESLTNANKWIY